MDKDFYINLIHKQLTGALSAKEEVLLRGYLNANSDHQQLADEIQLSWELGEEVQSIPDVDVEHELNRIHLRMDAQEKIGVESIAKASTSRNKLEGRVISLMPRYLAIAASLIALIVASTWFFNEGGIDGIDNIETITASNGTKTINLSDGSTIWLGEGGTIKYAKDQTREITLIGKAFFDVARDEMNPFKISIDETLVTVLGTSFSVEGAQDGRIELQVATGRVSMSNEYDEVILEKGNAAIYNPLEARISKVDFKDPLQEPWKSGRFIFKNQSLANIITEIEQYYVVEIRLSNDSLADCKKTMSTPVKGINEVIQAIATQFQLSVRKIADTSFMLDGDQCL